MAIPRGTLLAIVVTSLVYLGMAWVVGMTVHREVAVAMGCQSTINNVTGTGTNESRTCLEGLFVNDDTSYCGQCRNEGGDCEYFALLHSFQVIEMISLVGPIITAGEDTICCYIIWLIYDIYPGIFSATLSSALASLIGAPKIFQRVCQDKIFPYIGFFAKGQGRTGTEPIRGYILTYVIAAGCIVSLGMWCALIVVIVV